MGCRAFSGIAIEASKKLRLFFNITILCMKIRILLSAIMLLTSLLQVQAQFKFSNKPDEFIVNLQDMMKTIKYPPSIKNAEDLASAWNGGRFNDAQKKTVIELTQKMAQKRMKPRPHFENLVAMLNSAVNTKNLTDSKLSDFLYVTQKVADKQSIVQIQSYIETCRGFFDKNTLFTNNVYSLRASENVDFSFQYIETTDTSGLAAYTAPPVSKFADFDNDTPPVAEEPIDTSMGMPPMPRASKPSSSSSGDVPLQGAIIRLEKTDLTFQTKYDSSTIEQTSGSLMITYGLFVGKGGKFDWRMAGLDPADTYCMLKDYVFRVQFPEFAAKNVTMYYQSKVSQSVEGIFEFKSRRYKSPKQAQFPRFKSYKSDISLKNIGDDIMYRGGFSLAGSNISSTSVSGEPAVVKVKNNDRVAFISKSQRFEIGDSAITTKAGSVRMNVALDSIVHPSARVSYNRNSRKIEIVKDAGLYRATPFFDSYHKIEINCEGIKWGLDSAKISFYVFGANNRNPAYFESLDFFKDNRFDNLQGAYSFHPLLMVIGYSNEIKKESFNAKELAERHKLNLSTLQGGLASIASEGFITYNQSTGRVTLRDKAKHYFDAHKKKKDYDYMSVPSLAPRRANGVLDLNSNELTVSGVDKFFLSDSLGVYIIPTDRQVKILKNRDMVFDGRINAGSFLAHGQNFKFDYTEFKVDLQKIDSVILQLDAKKAFGRKKSNATGKLENRGIAEENDGKTDGAKATSGVLYINKKDNKSGLKQYKQYPIFDVVSNSYVYFDNKQVLNKAYNQKVRFKLPPFNVDSVASNDPNSISFDGTFIPDEIFPEFKERLAIRPDKSLGFTHKVPTEGYQLYKGAGKFFGTISLDNKGIRGKGEIQYLTSVIRSDDFIFYQDSVVTNGTTFVMKEGTIAKGNYPDASVTAFRMKWVPAVDSLTISNITSQDKYAAAYAKKYPKTKLGTFQLYEKTATLDGDLVVTSVGVNGAGKIKTRGSQIVSSNYTFDIDRFSGREAQFEIQSKDLLKPAVLCRDVKFLFNLKEKYAEFNPEREGFASNEFPYTRYKTSIPKAVWYLDKQIVEMDKPEDVDISNSYFYSTKPEQDSINFRATEAIYDIAKYTLNIKGVPYIRVADAQIFPDSGNVVVEEDAKMRLLANATMTLDTLNQYHRLTKADLYVYSRGSFAGKALYQYVNSDSDTLEIAFNSFAFIDDLKESTKKKKVIYTTSGGDVSAEEPLKITPGVLYKGHVAMDARKPNLDFDGEVRLDLKNTNNIVWLKYQNKESRDFALNLDGAKDAEGKDLQTGLFMEEGQLQLYTGFATPKRASTDKSIFSVAGNLKFLPETREFKVGNSDKINAKSYEGNVFTYNDSLQTAQFEGKYDLMTPNLPDRDFTLGVTGLTKVRLDSNFYDFNVLLSMECDLPSAAWKQMGKALATRAVDLAAPEANDDKTALLYKLADMAGERAAQDYNKLSQTQYTSIPSVISKMARGLLLSNVDLKWSQEHSAWYSIGKLGVSNVLRQDVNAKTDGYLEIKKTVTGTVFSLYLEASPDAWYYFSYDNAVKRMVSVSSNDDFNTVIGSKSKAAKAKPNQYAFLAADPIERVMFIKAFNKNYLGREITLEMLQKEREKDKEAASEEENDPLAPPGEKKEKVEAPASDSTAASDSAQAAPKAAPKVTPTPAVEDDGFGGDTKPAETTPAPAIAPVTPPPTSTPTSSDSTQKETEATDTPSTSDKPAEESKEDKKAKKEAEKAAKEAAKAAEKAAKEAEKQAQRLAEEAAKEAQRKQIEEAKKKAEQKKQEEEDAGGF